MERILKDLGLSALIQKFKEERIDEKVALSLSDSELIRLGVAKIGDRVRFRDLCKKSDTASGNASTSASSSGSYSNRTTEARTGLRERALIFNPRNNSRSSASATTKKGDKKRTWTANFVCLSDRLTNKIPSSSEKQVLQKAGLGSKKIKFYVDDDEKTKEFFRLVMLSIKEKYFDKGIREHLADDYETMNFKQAELHLCYVHKEKSNCKFNLT